MDIRSTDYSHRVSAMNLSTENSDADAGPRSAHCHCRSLGGGGSVKSARRASRHLVRVHGIAEMRGEEETAPPSGSCNPLPTPSDRRPLARPPAVDASRIKHVHGRPRARLSPPWTLRPPVPVRASVSGLRS